MYLQEEYQITNKKLMIQSLLLLGFTILLFALHGLLHMPVSIAALIGSLVLLAISGEDIVEMLEHEVEWPTWSSSSACSWSSPAPKKPA